MPPIISSIISIIISIFVLYVIYKIFESNKFWLAYAVSVAYGLISALMSGTSNILITIVVVLISRLIVVGIEYFAYKNTKSVAGFIILSVILEFGVLALTSLIFSRILAGIYLSAM